MPQSQQVLDTRKEADSGGVAQVVARRSGAESFNRASWRQRARHKNRASIPASYGVVTASQTGRRKICYNSDLAGWPRRVSLYLRRSFTAAVKAPNQAIILQFGPTGVCWRALTARAHRAGADNVDAQYAGNAGDARDIIRLGANEKNRHADAAARPWHRRKYFPCPKDGCVSLLLSASMEIILSLEDHPARSTRRWLQSSRAPTGRLICGRGFSRQFTMDEITELCNEGYSLCGEHALGFRQRSMCRDAVSCRRASTPVSAHQELDAVCHRRRTAGGGQRAGAR